jgi:molybdate transport system regulatory protein
MPYLGPLKIKTQVLCGSELAMGPGKADLLDAIDKEGSISAAGRAMGMSYRRTWLLVDTMNRCWKAPLVQTAPGGGRHSGAKLTEMGRQVLKAYRALEADLAKAASKTPLDTLQGLLLSRPRASQHEATEQSEDA